MHRVECFHKSGFKADVNTLSLFPWTRWFEILKFVWKFIVNEVCAAEEWVLR